MTGGAKRDHASSGDPAAGPVALDREGFVRNPSRWSEAVAEDMAREAGIATLSQEQWRVVRFIRRYYREQGKAPLNRAIRNGTGLPLARIEAMFPGGISKGARRLAGLPNPKGCAAG